MVDFRRWITALAVLTLFAGLAAAQVVGSQAPLSCSTNITATPQLRAEGYTETTGDITIQCTGGPNTPVGNTIPAVNITIFLNTQVTSRLLGSSGQSEALLLIDDPGNPFLPAATGASLQFGPLATQMLCSSYSSGCTEYVSSVPSGGVPTGCTAGTAGCVIPAGTAINVATNTPQGTTASANGYNVFQGVVSGNSVTWFGVPVLAPGTSGISRTFRFTNIRVNASALSGGSAAGATPVIASIAVSNTALLPITNPTPTVGFVQPGLSTSVGGPAPAALQQCQSGTLVAIAALTFKENFGTAFKTRVVPTGTAANSGQGTGGPQNVPGGVYNSESNFIQTSVGGNGATAGLADWGTRLKATFNNVPAGVRLFVSLNNVANAALGVATVPSPVGGTDTTDPYAEAVTSETAAENAGAGAFPVAATFSTSTTAPGGSGGIVVTELAVSGGTATAVWEVVNTNPSKSESLTFGVYATYVANVSQNSPPAGTATVNMSFAPTPPVFTAAQGSVASSGNVPRFIQDPNAAKSILTVNICRTILLYPFITNQAGFDTGIAIANTSTDPFGTGPQAGACQLNWYSGTTSPAATSSGSIASGTVYTTLASVTVPNFQGYMIAICQFQYAHGFAFISDLGARNLAMGYLALVVPDPAGNGGRGANPLSSGANGTGEILAQ